MSASSPSAYLLWSILSVLFLCFLVRHLWQYDRFQCLRWSAGRTPGAFRRVMTYSYLGTVPLLVVYSVGMTVLKYAEGFMIISAAPPGLNNLPYTVIARPVSLYTETGRRWVLPLDMVLSVAWALELVTHLEELTFWLYLLHQKPNKAPWFESWEYTLWCAGSLVSILGLPTTTIIVRHDADLMDAYIFLVGACASTINTIAFLYILARFPQFLHGVRRDCVPDAVVGRLVNFYTLNQTRILFRFLFTIPLLIISIDALLGAHLIAESIFWTDFLQMLSGVGCFASSAITLLVFFPRQDASAPQAQASPSAPSTPPSYKEQHVPTREIPSVYTCDTGALSLESFAFEPKYVDYSHMDVEERDVCECTGRECRCMVVGGERVRRVRTQPPRPRPRYLSPRFSPSDSALNEGRRTEPQFAPVRMSSVSLSTSPSRSGSPTPSTPDSPPLSPQRLSAQATPLRMPSPLTSPQATFRQVATGTSMIMRYREDKAVSVSMPPSPFAASRPYSPLAPPLSPYQTYTPPRQNHVPLPTLRRRERGGSGSELHPYVLTFTSPIDLVDIAAHARDQDRHRRRASALPPF